MHGMPEQRRSNERGQFGFDVIVVQLAGSMESAERRQYLGVDVRGRV